MKLCLEVLVLSLTCCLAGCYQNEPIDIKIRPISSPSASVGKQPEKRLIEEKKTTETSTTSPQSPAATTTTTTTTEVESTAPIVEHAPSAAFSKYDALVTAITVFMLAVYVGFEVISKVPTTLHTPLMSGSNAISGITVVGAMIVGGYSLWTFSGFLGFLATALAMINVVGGFLVTHRMLAMFKRK